MTLVQFLCGLVGYYLFALLFTFLGPLGYYDLTFLQRCIVGLPGVALGRDFAKDVFE